MGGPYCAAAAAADGVGGASGAGTGRRAGTAGTAAAGARDWGSTSSASSAPKGGGGGGSSASAPDAGGGGGTEAGSGGYAAGSGAEKNCERAAVDAVAAVAAEELFEVDSRLDGGDGEGYGVAPPLPEGERKKTEVVRAGGTSALGVIGTTNEAREEPDIGDRGLW